MFSPTVLSSRCVGFQRSKATIVFHRDDCLISLRCQSISVDFLNENECEISVTALQLMKRESAMRH